MSSVFDVYQVAAIMSTASSTFYSPFAPTMQPMKDMHRCAVKVVEVSKDTLVRAMHIDSVFSKGKLEVYSSGMGCSILDKLLPCSLSIHPPLLSEMNTPANMCTPQLKLKKVALYDLQRHQEQVASLISVYNIMARCLAPLVNGHIKFHLSNVEVTTSDELQCALNSAWSEMCVEKLTKSCIIHHV